MPLRPVIYQPQQIDYEHPGVKAASLRAMAEEARGRKLQSDELQRQHEAASQIRGVVGMYGGKITPKVASEISVIDPKAGMGVYKFLGEQEEQEAKGRREARLAETAALDLNLKKLAHVGGVLNTIQDEPSMVRAIGNLVSNDLMPRELAMHYLQQPWTPELQAEIKQAVESSKTTEQQLKDQLAANEEARKAEEAKQKAALHPAEVAKAQFEATKAGQEVTGTKPIQPAEQARLAADKAQAEALATYQAEQLKLTARGQDITIRGQNLTDARARELNAIAQSKAPQPFKTAAISIGNLRGAVDAYRTTLTETGPKLIPGTPKHAVLQSKFTDLQMQLKNLYQLGAITGPDLEILQRAVTSPTTVMGNWAGKETLKKQLDVFEGVLDRSEDVLRKTYNQPPREKKKDSKADPLGILD